MSRGKTLTTAAAAVAALLALTSCSNANHQAGSTTAAGSSAASSSATNPQAHNAQDVTFAQQMIPHHQQAIEMSDIVLGKQGIDPRVMDLATRIKDAQGPEIQEMQSWLSQWGQPTIASMPGMPAHSDMPGMPGMPGMMPERDMEALRDAQGAAASRLFLTQMVQHHQGAIAMAQNEIKLGQYSPAIAMAHSIVDSQQQEINTMQAIVSSL
ncbi:MAG: DUF305 domain-containing protein [Mycobacterium sp.]|nr:MAG: DUF305 domain-containing protein [Mycobacterium sp.]